MNINDVLPPELLAMIFSKIDDFADKVRLERVCKHWRQTVSLDWKTTKTCPVPLNYKSLVPVLNRWGEWLEEIWLWLQEIGLNENLINQMANQMKRLKHLKLYYCQLGGPAVNSIADLFGQQLCSFILDGTNYHPNMRRLIENGASKLEHLNLCLLEDNYSAGTLPTKLPNNLKSFSLYTGWNSGFYEDYLTLILNIAKDCKSLKILHLQIDTLLPNMFLAIGKIKSLVYLNLDVVSIENETTLQNVICRELPNLKALRIGDGAYCYAEMISNICRDRPDLVHLNVYAEQAFQMADSLNSLTLRNPWNMDFGQFLPEMLFINQQNKSIQHLDIHWFCFSSSSNFIENLLGQFPNLESLHCKMPASNADLTSFFSLIQKHLKNGRKITIYFHFYDRCKDPAHYKYILPDDLPRINKAGWKPEISKGKCENLVLKKLIKEAVDGGNNPSFLDDWWKE